MSTEGANRRTVLVTGCTGFVGRNIVRQLQAHGDNVVAFCRRVPPGLAEAPNVSITEGDLSTGRGLRMVPWPKVDAVIHLAASGVRPSRRDWSEAVAVNVLGTLHLLRAIAAFAARAPVVVLARSFFEDAFEAAPAFRDDPYVITKHVAAEAARTWAVGYPGKTVLARVFQVYGPGDDDAKVLSYAARQLGAGLPCEFGSGLGMKDWIYVDDAAAGLIAALDAPGTGCIEVDVGSGELRSVRAMVERLADLAGVSRDLLIFDPNRDRGDSRIDLAAERRVPGWKPELSRDGGLRRLLDAAVAQRA